jgi:uncharacterized membrane protein
MTMLGYYWGGAAHLLVGILVLLVFVGLVTAMVLFVARVLGGGHGLMPPAQPAPPPHPGPPPHNPSQPSAREILDRRLASGEITIEQYDDVRAKLDASDR